MARPKGSKNKNPAKPRGKKAETQQQEKPPEAQAKPSTGSASGSSKKPAKEQVVRLVKRLESMAADARSKTGEMGEVTAKAVENQHFDRTALSMVRKLYKMAKSRPQQLGITLPHLLAYIDDLELDKIADENRGMDLESDDDTADEQAAPPSAPSGGLRVVPKDEASPPPAETDAA